MNSYHSVVFDIASKYCILDSFVDHDGHSIQQYVNCELPDVQARFRKGRGTRDQIANIRWIIEKAGSSRKAYISKLLTMSKPLTVWITINCGKF